VVIGGIELAEKIKKGQFKTGKLSGRTARDAGNLVGCAGCLIGAARYRTSEVGQNCAVTTDQYLFFTRNKHIPNHLLKCHKTHIRRLLYAPRVE